MSIKKIKRILRESSIDFPHRRLSADVWDLRKDEYVLKDNVKTNILQALSSYPKADILESVKEVRIIGSICTNIYDKDSDIDIHIILKPSRLFIKLELLRDDVMDYFKKNRDIENWFAGTHPFEVYIQDKPKQDLLSDGVYDLLKDEWIKKPELKDNSYNPYDVFKDVFKTVAKLSGVADTLIGSLRRDLIDYESIAKALSELPKNKQNSLLHLLKDKLDEIESNIRKLSLEKDYWRTLRHKYNPSDEELDSIIELSKEWKDMNALFKLMNKYLYTKLITSLEVVIKDGSVTQDEINKIKNDLNNFMQI